MRLSGFFSRVLAVTSVALMMGLATSRAHATTETLTFDVASLTNGFDAVYTLTFDPTQNYWTYTSAGLVVDSITPGALNSLPTEFEYTAATGHINFANDINSSGFAVVNPGSDDYLLMLGDFMSDPIYGVVYFSGTDAPITFASVTATTPEPNEILLIGTGLIAAAAIMRMRRRQRVQ
jgi:hypothetical protein